MNRVEAVVDDCTSEGCLDDCENVAEEVVKHID